MSQDRIIYLPGPRVSLATLEREDVASLQRWINDPRVLRGLIQVRPYDAIAEAQWYENLDRGPTPSDVHFAIVTTQGHRLIGTTAIVGISWVHRHAQTASMLGSPDDWSKGYGTEAKALLCRYAFHTLGLHRLESHALASNLASQRHLLKNGYRQEGVFRKRIFREGSWHDTLHFGLLREDWEASAAHSESNGR